jgi:hypothetical protein
LKWGDQACQKDQSGLFDIAEGEGNLTVRLPVITHPEMKQSLGSAAVLGKIWDAAQLAPFISAQTHAAVPLKLSSAPCLCLKNLMGTQATW